jgi:hypothetical protein
MLNIVYYSNCQYAGINYFLQDAIPNKYNTFHLENYTLIKQKKPIPVDTIKRADLFIYQPIDKIHGIYSTDKSVENNIMSYLSPNCKVISFPYIYNSALWVLIPPANIDGYVGGFSNMDKYVNREPIEKLKSQGYSLNDVIAMYSNNEIDFDYENRFEKCIEILRDKERKCDAKVSDFIVKHIGTKRLFFTQNHPTTCVFVHISNQVLSILGYNVKYDEFAFPENICNLPGEWPTSSSDMNYWKFDYQCNIQDNWYIPHIINIYNNYQVKHIYPLSYSIPHKCVQNIHDTKKTRLFSPLIPGDNTTYIYKDENSYNNNYKESWFAFTYKKGGYDCLRHYEIIANNAIPFYIDIDKVPEKTITTFPKKLVKKAMNVLISTSDTSNQNEILNTYIQELHDYTINNLTCEKIATNFVGLINRLNGCSDSNSDKKIIMITNNTMNYSMMSLAYGLRMNCSSNFIDFPRMNNLYNKSQYNLHIEDNIQIDRSNIEDKLRNKYYDYVIIGSVGPDEGWSFQHYENLIRNVYKKTEIIYIFGGDRPFNISKPNKFHTYLNEFLQKGLCFIRELDDNTDYYHETTWGEYVTECVEKWNDKIKRAKIILHDNLIKI